LRCRNGIQKGDSSLLKAKFLLALGGKCEDGITSQSFPQGFKTEQKKRDLKERREKVGDVGKITELV
jgi:hypothetical protein